MIYICKGCEEIIKAPCTLCRYGCSCCKESCAKFCELWEPITGNPLGGYVLFTWLMAAVVIACAAAGFSSCSGSGTIVCLVDIVLAIVHAAFAYYLQRQLVAGLQRRGWEEGQQKNHKDITKETWAIVKYDVGFCLYFFVFIGAFAFQCWAFTVINECDGSLAMIAVALMIVFSCLAWFYASCWTCGQCCFAKANYTRKKKGAKELPAEQIGDSSA